MKDSHGYIRRGSGKSALACAQIAEKARKGDPSLAHTPIPPEAHQGVDHATPPAGRTFGLCGAPDPATAGALKCAADFLEGRGRATREGPRPMREVIRGIYRELHEEIAPALRHLSALAASGALALTSLPAPGTILAHAGAWRGEYLATPPPPPPAPVYGPAVRVYEALWALWRAETHRTRDLYDLAALAAVDKASGGRIGPASLSKLLSTLCAARCAHRLPGRGRFVLHEPTAERRAALSIARRGE